MVTKLTALIIQSRGDDIKCEILGQTKEGKVAGVINLYRDGEYDHALLSSEPIFDSDEQCLTKLNEIVSEIRSTKI